MIHVRFSSGSGLQSDELQPDLYASTQNPDCNYCKTLLFASPCFCEPVTFNIFTILCFCDYPFFCTTCINLLWEILARTLISRLCCLKNLRENKVHVSKRCFTVIWSRGVLLSIQTMSRRKVFKVVCWQQMSNWGFSRNEINQNWIFIIVLWRTFCYRLAALCKICRPCYFIYVQQSCIKHTLRWQYSNVSSLLMYLIVLLLIYNTQVYSPATKFLWCQRSKAPT